MPIHAGVSVELANIVCLAEAGDIELLIREQLVAFAPMRLQAPHDIFRAAD